MRRFLCILTTSLLLLASQAFADTIYSFDDTWVDWPGYTSNKSGIDEYGTPKIDSMSVTLDDGGSLKSVDIFLSGSQQWETYNSLFINSYSDSTPTQWDEWDYFVHDGGFNHSGNTVGNIPGDGVYSVNQDWDSSMYTMTTSYGYVRQDTPNGIDNDYLTGLGQGSGWNADSSGYVYSYDFSGIQDIDLSDGFFIAFAPFCANDVMGGGIDLSPVPEPTTMALLGMGLVALAGVSRKRYTEEK